MKMTREYVLSKLKAGDKYFRGVDLSHAVLYYTHLIDANLTGAFTINELGEKSYLLKIIKNNLTLFNYM